MSHEKMPPKTKIICTIGPSCNTLEDILKLIDAGMNVARINFSHGTREEHAEIISRVKEARKERDIPIAIMLDTKGPEIRVTNVIGEQIELAPKQRVKLLKDNKEPKKEDEICIYPEIVIDQLQVGVTVLFDDGKFVSKVVEKEPNSVTVEFINGGVLEDHKGVNIPQGNISIPHVTDKDLEDLKFGCEQGVDVVAASFVNNAEHVLEIKHILAENGGPYIMVMAKIESYMGVKNFESIVHVSDGIMVARGDLGVEMPIEQVPRLQKDFIFKCYRAGKPVAIATQMLESMMYSPSPTRAEVSDVANAIYDSASCVMLSGETAVGKYPIETVRMMRRIIEQAESEFKYRDYFYEQHKQNFYDVSSAVAGATVKTCYSADAKGIVVCTIGGATARSLSRFRPAIPILAITPSRHAYNRMAINWGIIPIYQKVHTVSEAIHYASCYAMDRNILSYGDLIVVTAGSPFNVSGSTNMMIVEIIGDVLVRGERHGERERIHGQISIILVPNEKAVYDAKNKIVILSTCDESCSEIIRNCKGVILQNHHGDTDSSDCALKLCEEFDKPIITCADSALSILQNGQFVTLDSEKGAVFKGSLDEDDDMYGKLCKVIEPK